MLIIQRLYIKEFVKTFLILVLGLASVFSAIRVIDKIDDFMPHKPQFGLILKYTFLSIPKYIHYLFPMAALLSALFIFAQASRHREIDAIKSAGGKIKRIFAPFIGIGIILTLFDFALGEIIVPATSKKLHEIKNKITRKEKGISFKEGVLYMRGKDGSIVRMSLYMPDKNLAKGISILRFDEEGLKERIDAETAEWEAGIWKLRHARSYDIASGKITKLKELTYPAIESPKTLQEGIWRIEEMSLFELIRYNKNLKNAGFKNIKLIVDISSRLSYPFINLLLMLLGIALSASEGFIEQKLLPKKIKESSIRGGIVTAGIGLLISLIYWISYSLSLSLGYAGALPPVIAPWIVPFLFGGVAVYLYNQISE